ncbi:MAG: hypothetical protein QXU92_02220 [Candidatus Diapherotrites archaeon]
MKKALFASITLLLLAGLAFAFPFGKGMQGKFGLDESVRAEIEKALETKNYDEFVRIHKENNLRMQNISKAQFDLLAKNYELNNRIDQAIDSLDYKTWSELMAQKRSLAYLNVNEQNFYLLKELKDAKANNDFAKVREIMSELGFGNGLGKGLMRNGKFGRNFGNYNCPMLN